MDTNENNLWTKDVMDEKLGKTLNVTFTPQPLYYSVWDITRIIVGPQFVIKDLFSYVTIHFTLVITRFG